MTPRMILVTLGSILVGIAWGTLSCHNSGESEVWECEPEKGEACCSCPDGRRRHIPLGEDPGLEECPLSYCGIPSMQTSTGVPTTTDVPGTTDGSTATDTSASTASTTSSFACLNGVKEGSEACDGDDFGGKTCKDFGFSGDGKLGCDSHCDVDVTQCPVCGDGIPEGEEQCDCGNQGKVCSPAQLGNAACGDIPGFHGGKLACNSGDCSYDDSGCFSCGDGVKNGIEACDGDDLGQANCVNIGFSGGNLACAMDCAAFDLSSCTSVCGNNTKEPDEQCDDGNPNSGDGCSSDCKEERWVFVTEASLGNMGGIDGADSICATAATENDLEPPMGFKYKAWLGTGTSSPSVRFDTGFSGYYRLRNDTYSIVAKGWVDLTDGILEHAINVTAKGDNVNGGPTCAWSNVALDGKSLMGSDCSGWDEQNDPVGSLGFIDKVDSAWTDGVMQTKECFNGCRLYCFLDKL